MARPSYRLDCRLGAVMVKRVLMVAYHFPPMNVSSGIQRTLRFAQYLPEFNWEPIVLTAHPRAYPGVSEASLSEVPVNLRVQRAFALDTAKHLSLFGRYPRFMCVPDRWWSWWLGAILPGLALIRELKPDVLWSTYPIASAHLIGYTLHRLTGIRWIADFRDPMAQSGYPADALTHRAYEWIEHQTLKHCERATFTAPGAVRLYAERYADIPSSRFTIIENGYDESTFAGMQQVPPPPLEGRPLVLIHSGTVYPSERDPRSFFGALAALRNTGRISASNLRVILRATGCDDYLRPLIAGCGISDIVTLEPTIPYKAALSEMLMADGLLVLQAANCNYQVPAKLYEYLRAKRPILGLTDPSGDTASVLRSAGIDTIAPLDSQAAIAQELIRFVDLLRRNCAPVAGDAQVAASSRRAKTMQLAEVLDAAAC